MQISEIELGHIKLTFWCFFPLKYPVTQTRKVPTIEIRDDMNKNALELTLNATLRMMTIAEIAAQEKMTCTHRDKKTQLDITAAKRSDSRNLSENDTLGVPNELRKVESLRLQVSRDSFLDPSSFSGVGVDGCPLDAITDPTYSVYRAQSAISTPVPLRL